MIIRYEIVIEIPIRSILYNYDLCMKVRLTEILQIRNNVWMKVVKEAKLILINFASYELLT